MAMTSSTTRDSSGALPCRSRVLPCFLSLERGIQGGGERRLAAHQRGPGKLLAVTLAFGDKLQALRRDGEHEGLAVDLDFALQRLVELRCHRLFAWVDGGDGLIPSSVAIGS